MSTDTITPPVVAGDRAAWPSLRKSPGRFLGLALAVFLRLFYGLFFFLAGLNKVLGTWDGAWVTEIFEQRLTELNPDSFASFYIENFAMHVTGLIAFVVTWGEFVAGAGLLLGLCTRWAALLALFILINIAIGGYFDASLLPFFAINVAACIWPLGQKFGLDRFLHRRLPDSILFR
jgi:thiosulfate dehydrogenase [quinone] large subunit